MSSCNSCSSLTLLPSLVIPFPLPSLSSPSSSSGPSPLPSPLQPVHHVLWMMAALADNATSGCAPQGQYWLRKAVTQLYQPGVDMGCGDDDNGEESAWYLLSALGIYSLAPGSQDYVLGSPLFGEVVITQPGSSSPAFTVQAVNNSPSNVYVQSVEWNGKPVDATTIPYSTLMAGGGVLTFYMGPQPASSSSSAAKA